MGTVGTVKYHGAMPAAIDVAEHRRRLLDAMAHAAAAKGYAAVTIADLAAEARVSRRTFYEHFDDKAACLIALYEAASAQSLAVLRAQVDTSRDWHTQVEQALRAYFETLASNPPLLRTLFIEILGLGTPGLAARRRANRELAAFITQVLQAQSAHLATPLAVGIVGAINELVLQAIEEDRIAQLPELVSPAAQLVRTVIDGSR